MKRSVSLALAFLLFIVVALSGSTAAKSKDREHPDASQPVSSLLLAIPASPLSNEL